ncbi:MULTISPECIES: Crp/Fnr family transcriptional regulator [unclassified Arcicella]|jgi:CRP-like cAMP-binding protein|uniref:Crp/Fnr family transcriptional regulator n=1 Tax=unclassified Arcicella TaxID=2644986 RepID=UPI00286552CD|nr:MULTISPECIES: Crp/Fnr family transcriptional regulator [unclassified Arcicella]MCA6440993.1 Crp/Fnr family transcriptional regulator [Chitinophagaceae bacterium]MCA6447788.1 Crp/Fnr family transcriptional regulator [Chitinophagaceae bacterium]MDR6561485.1 CRP-like cAMP-binding protein [Arcicella sp. BE51]MDR6811368.1 CRP-like cAMP-binding protein [Arcicella sp. BE140]MDR6822719.1 CRP-like cAMP-binding protein [Arcicella sp. BE139]
MIYSLLNSIQNVISLTATEKDIIASLWKGKTYKKGDLFLAEGQVCRQVGFITKGLIRYYINHNGEDKTYAFAKEGDFICNYESFIPQTPSQKNIQALEDCEILQISHDDLQQFYKSIGQAERFGRLVIEQVFIQTLHDLSSFYTDSPEDRYERFLTEHPDLQQRISQYHIASYVGVKPQSLSRIRKRIFSQK